MSYNQVSLSGNMKSESSKEQLESQESWRVRFLNLLLTLLLVTSKIVSIGIRDSRIDHSQWLFPHIACWFCLSASQLTTPTIYSFYWSGSLRRRHSESLYRPQGGDTLSKVRYPEEPQATGRHILIQPIRECTLPPSPS